MREIVTVAQAARAVRAAAVALPALGVLLGIGVGAVRRSRRAGLVAGALCAAAGPALWGLWRLHGAIVEGYGLDSVRGLLVALAAFVALGFAAGLGAGALWRRFGARAGG